MGGTPSRGAAMMKGSGTTGGQKQSIPLEDALNILLQGFLKGKRYSATHKSFPLECSDKIDSVPFSIIIIQVPGPLRD